MTPENAIGQIVGIVTREGGRGYQQFQPTFYRGANIVELFREGDEDDSAVIQQTPVCEVAEVANSCGPNLCVCVRERERERVGKKGFQSEGVVRI